MFKYGEGELWENYLYITDTELDKVQGGVEIYLTIMIGQDRYRFLQGLYKGGGYWDSAPPKLVKSMILRGFQAPMGANKVLYYKHPGFLQYTMNMKNEHNNNNNNNT